MMLISLSRDNIISFYKHDFNEDLKLFFFVVFAIVTASVIKSL